MKIIFLDESGDHNLVKIDPSYPMFVLAGCVFDMDYYINTVEPAIDKLKIDHFGKSSVILRSYDIRKQKGDFSCLVDKKKQDAFHSDFNELFSSLDFTVIASAINKSYLKNQYSDPDNPYHLCFEFILERIIMYLGRSKESMLIRIESRETHNDKKLAEVYSDFRARSGGYFDVSEIRSKINDLSFNQKTQNIAGMQIADLVAYPIGRWVLDKNKENKPFEFIKQKIHSKNGKYLNYGLKIFP